jgi:hypothetical protein
MAVHNEKKKPKQVQKVSTVTAVVNFVHDLLFIFCGGLTLAAENALGYR